MSPFCLLLLWDQNILYSLADWKSTAVPLAIQKKGVQELHMWSIDAETFETPQSRLQQVRMLFPSCSDKRILEFWASRALPSEFLPKISGYFGIDFHHWTKE